MSAPEQVTAIHTLRKQIPGFTDADYRADLRALFGVTSCTQLSYAQAAGLIAKYAKLATPKPRAGAGAARVSGQYGRALQALWIAAWNLGVVEKRDDRALLAFVERQTGLSHTRFLHDAGDARKAIEGLKAWIAREGKVSWPKNRSLLARKHAIVEAQAAIMRERLPTFDPQAFGALQGYGASLDAYDEDMLDRLSAAIGRTIRREKDWARRRAA